MNAKPRSGQRTSTFTTLNGGLWIFITFMFLLQLNHYFHVSLIFGITWFIIGITFGVTASTLITRWQLKKLDKKGEDPATLKTTLIHNWRHGYCSCSSFRNSIHQPANCRNRFRILSLSMCPSNASH